MEALIVALEVFCFKERLSVEKWVMDVFYHPSKYVKVIREIRNIYNSEHSIINYEYKFRRDTYYH